MTTVDIRTPHRHRPGGDPGVGNAPTRRVSATHVRRAQQFETEEARRRYGVSLSDMAGDWPESARPLLEEVKRRAVEALKPVVDEAARRMTAEMALRDATEVAELAWEVRTAITAQFVNHLAAGVPRGTNIDPAMGAMATAAVDVFLDYLRRTPVPPANGDTSTATEG